MHFMVDDKDKIKGFHIEMWDKMSLGEELSKEVESYDGKSLDKFLKFSLKKKLFLHTTIMYMMRQGGGTVYFWAAPRYMGPEMAEQLTHTLNMFGDKLKPSETIKYAKFVIEVKGMKDKAVLYEDSLCLKFKEEGCKEEIFTLNMKKDEIDAVPLDFNVSRNSVSGIRILKDISGKETLLQMTSDMPAFLGVKKNNSLDVFGYKDVETMTIKELEKYQNILSTGYQDEKQKKYVEDIFKRFKSLKEENNKDDKKTDESTHKQEKKGFFSRLRGK